VLAPNREYDQLASGPADIRQGAVVRSPFSENILAEMVWHMLEEMPETIF
jgi:hypothetical protein